MLKKSIAKTKNLSNLIEAFAFLQSEEDEQMLCTIGVAGTGKTTGAKYLAKHFNCAFVTARPKLSIFKLTQLILADALDLPLEAPICNSTGVGLDRIVRHLRVNEKALIVDEVDWLSPTAIEVLRSIHDEAQVPVCLFGMPGAHGKLSKHQQLWSRIHFLQFQPLDFPDTKLLADARCDVGIDRDLLSKIYEQSKGNVRLMKRMFAYVEQYAKAMGWEFCSLREWGNQPLLPKVAQHSSINEGEENELSAF